MTICITWYDDYLKMIYPRTPLEELEYAYPDVNINDLLKQAYYKMEVFKDKLSQVSLTKNIRNDVDDPTLELLIEFLGVIKTISLQFNIFQNESEKFLDLFKNFEKFLENEPEKIYLLLRQEVDSRLKILLKEWKNFVILCTQKVSTEQFQEYWDMENETSIMYNGEEDYESFIKRIASNTQLLKVIDYWDYLSGLSNRYFISRTLQLANNNLPIEQYQQELDCLDRQFQSVAIIDNNILKDSIKHFFPEAYYWWYYQISKDIFLYGRDF